MSFFLHMAAAAGAVFFALLSIWFFRRARAADETLQRCSDSLQEIFKLLEEGAPVSRILAQEPPEEELERLKYLLEQRGQKTMVENRALRQVLAGIPDGIAALDHSQSIVFYNPKFCTLLDVPENSRTGQKLFEVLRNHAALNAAEEFLQSSKSAEEIEFQCVSGRILKMRFLRLEDSPLVQSVLVLTDVSALKKLEAMRRDFVANVSHELRTPLTSIQGVTETLLSGAGEDSAARARFLDLMAKDTGRLKRLIDDLLSLTKLENQPKNIQKEKFDTDEELAEVLELMEAQLARKEIKVQKKGSAEIYASRDQFRQAMINLLDNAVKFSPLGSVISVEARRAKRGTEVSVADQGAGVQPENRDKIFQRFFREDRARSRGEDGGGTGLGLAIVKHIAEAHGGSARCEAGADGRGSVFTLFFPD